MTEQGQISQPQATTLSTHCNEFSYYCEAEFERRSNSDNAFDEKHYRAAMQLVMDKLSQLTNC